MTTLQLILIYNMNCFEHSNYISIDVKLGILIIVFFTISFMLHLNTEQKLPKLEVLTLFSTLYTYYHLPSIKCYYSVSACF